MQTLGVEKFKTLTGHNGAIYAIAPGIIPDTFYSSGNDGMIVEWKLDGSEHGKMLAKVSNSVYAMSVIKETGHLIVGHNYEGIHIIDIDKGSEMWVRCPHHKQGTEKDRSLWVGGNNKNIFYCLWRSHY